MAVIKVEGINIYAYHGCLEEEAKIGTDYIVNVLIEADFDRACETDELADTVDYVKVYEIVKSQMAIRSKLIEHVARRILFHIRTDFRNIVSAEVTVSKLNPPMNGNVNRVSFTLKG